MKTIQLEAPAPSTMSEYSKRRFATWQEKRKKLYDDPFVRILLLALKGDGKTTTCATARKPIHICSFDPSGTTSIRHLVKEGGIEVDDRYESEDLREPKAMDMWQADFKEMETSNYFNELGTYCIDSGYLWMEALLAKQRYKFHGAPIDDAITKSQLVGKDMRNLFGWFLEANLYWTRRLLSIPCNVIFTCHIDRYTDPVTGESGTSILSPGLASKERVPVPFPEVWVKQKDDKGKHWLLVEPEGRWTASTRIGSNGALSGRQPADVCAILSKCGLPTEPRSVFSE